MDGREAVAKAIELKPDVIILDFAMPRLDGLKAAKEISTLVPEVPIILHTLYGSDVGMEPQKHGIRRVVDKANPGALISAVGELLNASLSQPTSHDASETAAPNPARTPVSLAHHAVEATSATSEEAPTTVTPPNAIKAD